MRLVTPYWTTNARRYNYDLWSEMEKFFDDSQETTRQLNPAFDIHESDAHFLVSVDLPGLKKQDIKIEAIDQKLMISGERKREEKNDAKFQRFEKSYGKFEKVFTLPRTVDADKIEARFEDGVLELYLPKVEAEQPKKIEIQSGKGGFFEKWIGKSEEKSESTQAS